MDGSDGKSSFGSLHEGKKLWRGGLYRHRFRIAAHFTGSAAVRHHSYRRRSQRDGGNLKINLAWRSKEKPALQAAYFNADSVQPRRQVAIVQISRANGADRGSESDAKNTDDAPRR